MIPTSHRSGWCWANVRRNTSFLANVFWMAWHFDLKVQHSTKGEVMWENRRGAIFSLHEV